MFRGLCILLLTCLLTVVAERLARREARLMSGTNVAPGQFPFVVSLRINNEHRCGGAIVSNYHVLTAAHCVHPYVGNPQDVLVVTGTSRLYQGGELHRVARIFVHPDFDPINIWHKDIAVVQLLEPVVFNNVQNRIDLPTAEPPVYETALALGWGWSAPPPQGTYSNNLQKLGLRIIRREECAPYYQPGLIDDTMICTFNGPKVGACLGDSGGPLILRNQLIGIISGGIPCGKGIPDYYADVFRFLPFIRRAMGQ